VFYDLEIGIDVEELFGAERRDHFVIAFQPGTLKDLI
jgi:hypothetical protein